MSWSRWFLSVVAVALVFGGCGPTRSQPAGDDDDTGTVLPNEPPKVVILSPDDGTVVARRATVGLEVQVEDRETLPEMLRVEWTSDQEGFLGQPRPDSEGEARLNVELTWIGTQILTVTVTDEAGDTAQADLTLVVDGPPSASIIGADKRNPYEGEEVTFTGKVSDEEDDPPDLDVVWSDTRGNRLGASTPDMDGSVSLTTDRLSAGSQTIVLTATDSMGSQAQDTFKITVQRCLDQDGDGATNCDGDCADNDPGVYPGAVELCDGLDQNCDGVADDGLPDTDGNGVPDCRDQEVCDGKDNDGDGEIDEGFDQDEDGITTCEGDCDDSDPLVYPGATEFCDGKDTDCDGVGDLEYPDTDQDGVPDCVDAEECDGLDNDGDGEIDNGFDEDMDGFISCEDDCDDSDPNAYPGADEICDGKDQNCDGNVDGEYPDTDGDGVPDCVDVEECDGVDNDGNGIVDDGFDQDRDHYTVCGGDCDDLDPAIHPDAREFCDDLDNDCDGWINEGLGDQYEENNSLAEAYDLGDRNGVNEPVTTVIVATVHTPMDSDWYLITVADDGGLGPDQFYISVTLTDIAEGADYDLYLWWDDPMQDSSPETYVVEQSSNPGNQDESVLHTGRTGPEDGGDYWIEVRWVSGFSCDQPYTLTIENMG